MSVKTQTKLTKKTVTLEDIHFILITQTAEAQYHLHLLSFLVSDHYFFFCIYVLFQYVITSFEIIMLLTLMQSNHNMLKDTSYALQCVYACVYACVCARACVLVCACVCVCVCEEHIH